MSFCMHCGSALAETDRFCQYCGKPTAAQAADEPVRLARPGVAGTASPAGQPPAEQELLSFGPMGVQVYRGRPGVFTMCQQNNTRVILPNLRLFGTPKGTPLIPPSLLLNNPRKCRFHVPLGDIVSLEPCTLLLARGVWVRYRQGPNLAEVSVLGAVFIAHHLERLLQLLHSLTLPR